MTPLKTLKDFRIFKWNDYEYENMDISNEEYSKGTKAEVLRKDAIKVSDLKAEAIKWVKADLMNDKELADITDYGTDVIGFIKHFFNLTDAEINDEERK